VLRDLSRIHQLEAEVRRAETLAAAGRMAVGLAHEVRNPLGAIRGAVQLLRRELGPDSRLGEYTDVLLTEVDRVNRIIEMLLDLARPIQLRAVPLNLHQLLERVTLLNEEGARERGVTMIRRYDPSLPPILGDEDRLLQVFHNLVRNALDAMERGGRLTLTTRVSLNPLFGKIDLGTGQRIMVGAGDRRGRRHSCRRPRADLRPVLHDQGQGPRPRALDLPSHSRGAPWRDPGGERRGARNEHDVLPSDRELAPLSGHPRFKLSSRPSLQ